MAPRTTKTTTTKTTAANVKTTTATAKAVAQAPVETPKAMVVESVQPTISGLPIKKPELIDRVVTETGMKKKDVKPVVEAMLAVLARTLSGGEEITAPPMGKLMIKREKDLPKAKVLTLKLRIPKADNGVRHDPSAAAAE